LGNPNPKGVILFFFLACGITWALDVPWAWACATGVEPSEAALALTGLGAWGPTLAALAVAWRQRDLRRTFGRWRTNPIWLVLALLLPAALHLVATVIEVLLGGEPHQWFYPPTRPEHIAALVMFSFGEEFGWRGFAHPRLAERLGVVRGSLLLGAVWGLWHLGTLFTPEGGAPAATTVLYYMVELALWSVVVAWFFERARCSMAVAIALHAGAHLDNVYRAPDSEVRLHVLRFVVLAVAAAAAAWALRRQGTRRESN
jgi:membrane protease YdiL (CAAX protease family)